MARKKPAALDFSSLNKGGGGHTERKAFLFQNANHHPNKCSKNTCFHLQLLMANCHNLTNIQRPNILNPASVETINKGGGGRCETVEEKQTKRRG
jgi:hypothetical protein